MRSDGRSFVIRSVMFGLLTAHSLVATVSYSQNKKEEKGDPHLSDDKLPHPAPPKPPSSPCDSKPSQEEVKKCKAAVKCGLQPGASCPPSSPPNPLARKKRSSSSQPPAVPGSTHLQQPNQNKAITNNNVSQDKPTEKQH
jgi:hypothetical protein